MLHDVDGKTLPGLMDIRCQLRGIQSKTKEILDHVRPKPGPAQGEPNRDAIRTEANKVMLNYLGEILTGAKIVLFSFMAAFLVLGFRSIQDRKEIRRLTERLEAVERVAHPSQK